jgi:hypothetical protein
MGINGNLETLRILMLVALDSIKNGMLEFSIKDPNRCQIKDMISKDIVIVGF